MWSHGKFYWNELMTRDVEASKKFFGDALGWTFESMPTPAGGGTYWIAKAGDEPAAGLFPIGGEQFAQVPEAWLGYIAVDDVDARVKKATKAGGKVMREPFDIPGVGRIAILLDSRGAAIGMMTPAAGG
jgi:predicted enzyme related to lactoylglutathione lyase